MEKQVMTRGVDDDVYRQAKAAAALRGMPMGSAVTEALKAWVTEKATTGGDDELHEDIGFVKSSWRKLKKHSGKAVVISSGKLQGVFESYEDACAYSSKFRMALTFVVGNPPEEHEVEFGPDLEVQQGLLS
jgi:hypothetical protein